VIRFVVSKKKRPHQVCEQVSTIADQSQLSDGLYTQHIVSFHGTIEVNVPSFNLPHIQRIVKLSSHSSLSFSGYS